MVLFDTLKASLRLREAGFDEEKAGAIVSTFAEDIDDRIATKDDLRELRDRLEERFGNMEDRFEERFGTMEELIQQRLTLRMGMMLTIASGVLLTAIGIATGVIVSM